MAEPPCIHGTPLGQFCPDCAYNSTLDPFDPYKALNESDRAYADGVRSGAAAERARIVAWLQPMLGNIVTFIEIDGPILDKKTIAFIARSIEQGAAGETKGGGG